MKINWREFETDRGVYLIKEFAEGRRSLNQLRNCFNEEALTQIHKMERIGASRARLRARKFLRSLLVD